MAQSIIEEIGHILPPSQNLADTLARAADYAAQQSHPEVTLEHLLLALTEDPDAALVLSLSKVEIDQLKGDVSTHLGRLEDRSSPAGAVGISANLRQILEAAAAAARGRRSAIDGAIVLAAIVGDGRSTAAHLLRAHGLTFEEAIKALQQAAQAAEAEPASSESTHLETSGPESVGPESGSESADPETAEPQPVEVESTEWVEDPQGGFPLAPEQQQPIDEPPAQQSFRHPAGATPDEILASARQRVQDRFAPEVIISDDDAFDGNAARTGTAATGAEPKSHEFDQHGSSATPASAMPEHYDHQPEAESQRHAPFGDAEAAGPGPRPAPPAKRPLPPGAIRPGEAEPVPEAPPAEPAQRQGSRIEESAIDEVLASIRKVGKVPADQPHSPHLPPPPPQRPARAAEPPPPSPSVAPPPAAAHPSSLRPADHDFFGQGGQGHATQRGGAAPPQHMPMPPPPPRGRHAGPPRAPLPGLPSTHPGARPPPPPAPAPAPSAPMPWPQTRTDGAHLRMDGAAHHPRADGNASSPPPQVPPQWGPVTPMGAQRPGPAPAGPSLSAEAPQRQRSPELSLGEMVENIPRSMRVSSPALVEVRIARSEVKALADGLQGGGGVWRHDLTVTKAMSVRLRAPEGGFFIETSSPETQWIENTMGLITDDYASWRWTVTPTQSGTKRLQLIISARTVGTDGLTAETALPDQVVNVKVRVNYVKTVKKIGGWALAAIAGGVLASFGENLPAKVMSLVGTIFR
jgi:hypothetical protein